MFSLVAGRAQRRGRADEPIRTQCDRTRSRERPIASTKRRSVKESDSSNNFAPIIVGPLTTNQDLEAKGEKVFNLPLMIQQPFLREKKEPIKVDISVKLIPKARKKEKKKRDIQVEEITVHIDENKGVKNSFSMEITDDSVQVLKHDVEPIEAQNEINDSQESIIKETEGLMQSTELMNTEETAVKVEDVPDIQAAAIENGSVDATIDLPTEPLSEPTQSPENEEQIIKSYDSEPVKEEDSEPMVEDIDNIEETKSPRTEAQFGNENIEPEAS